MRHPSSKERSLSSHTENRLAAAAGVLSQLFEIPGRLVEDSHSLGNRLAGLDFASEVGFALFPSDWQMLGIGGLLCGKVAFGTWRNCKIHTMWHLQTSSQALPPLM